jgi:hypothetical protein
MTKEYIVTFKTSSQISPDDWDVYNPCLKVTEETTVKDIEAFYRKYSPISIMQVSLIEVETLSKPITT